METQMEDEVRFRQQQEWVDPEKRKQYIWMTSHPLVYRCLELFSHGQMSYQDALELAVCYLTQENKEQFDKICELITRLPMQPTNYVPPPPSRR